MNSSKPKFLVVDDYPNLRDLTVMVLADLGYTGTDTAVDGLEAFEKLQRGRYDCVISDIDMPRLNGFGLLCAIRTNPSLRHLPVILVTGNSAPQMTAAAIEQGAVACLVKPFRSEALEQAIEKALASPVCHPA